MGPLSANATIENIYSFAPFSVALVGFIEKHFALVSFVQLTCRFYFFLGLSATIVII